MTSAPVTPTLELDPTPPSPQTQTRSIHPLPPMAPFTTTRMLSATADLLASSAASLTHRRLFTRVSAGLSPRIAPQPPDLIRWVRREGGFVHPKLKIADHSSYGLGLVSDGEIVSGSELIALPDHIPLRLRWSPDAEDASDRPDSVLFQLVHRVPGVNRTCGEHVAEELWAMRLGVKLLQQRAAVGSFWWPYISNLPEAFTVPTFFTGEEIRNLQYAPLLHQVNKRCRFLLDFEKEVKIKLEDVTPANHPFCGQDVNAACLGWALTAVSSRAFRLHGQKFTESSHADVPMLLPLIDMCNHSFNPNARIVQDQDSNNQKMLVQVVSGTHIEQGSPITLNYGCLNNDLFILDYGFVVPSNPYDCVELKYDRVLLDAASMAAGVSSPSFSSPAPWQLEILSKLDLHGPGALPKVTLGGPELVDGRLLAALRVLLATDIEIVKKHDLNTLKLLSVQAPLGVSIEIDTLRTIIALCAISLQHFPTKIMEDETLLKGNVSNSMKLAIEFRMQKKSMIIDVMRGISKKIRLLAPEKFTAQS